LQQEEVESVMATELERVKAELNELKKKESRDEYEKSRVPKGGSPHIDGSDSGGEGFGFDDEVEAAIAQVGKTSEGVLSTAVFANVYQALREEPNLDNVADSTFEDVHAQPTQPLVGYADDVVALRNEVVRSQTAVLQSEEAQKELMMRLELANLRIQLESGSTTGAPQTVAAPSRAFGQQMTADAEFGSILLGLANATNVISPTRLHVPSKPLNPQLSIMAAEIEKIKGELAELAKQSQEEGNLVSQLAVLRQQVALQQQQAQAMYAPVAKADPELDSSEVIADQLGELNTELAQLRASVAAKHNPNAERVNAMRTEIAQLKLLLDDEGSIHSTPRVRHTAASIRPHGMNVGAEQAEPSQRSDARDDLESLSGQTLAQVLEPPLDVVGISDQLHINSRLLSAPLMRINWESEEDAGIPSDLLEQMLDAQIGFQTSGFQNSSISVVPTEIREPSVSGEPWAFATMLHNIKSLIAGAAIKPPPPAELPGHGRNRASTFY
jgi:ribosomal protein L29